MLQGFLNVRMATWKRRLITRTAAVTPAALLQYAYGDQGTYQLLVMMQVWPPPGAPQHDHLCPTCHKLESAQPSEAWQGSMSRKEPPSKHAPTKDA